MFSVCFTFLWALSSFQPTKIWRTCIGLLHTNEQNCKETTKKNITIDSHNFYCTLIHQWFWVAILYQVLRVSWCYRYSCIHIDLAVYILLELRCISHSSTYVTCAQEIQVVQHILFSLFSVHGYQVNTSTCVPTDLLVNLFECVYSIERDLHNRTDRTILIFDVQSTVHCDCQMDHIRLKQLFIWLIQFASTTKQHKQRRSSKSIHQVVRKTSSKCESYLFGKELVSKCYVANNAITRQKAIEFI